VGHGVSDLGFLDRWDFVPEGEETVVLTGVETGPVTFYVVEVVEGESCEVGVRVSGWRRGCGR
jgi:hypothetical protein